VYFANTIASTHPLWNSWLLNLTDGVTSAKERTTPNQFEYLQSLEEDHQPNLKVPIDFSIALQYMYDTSSSPYIGFFEGDIIFANSWFARTLLGLGQIVHKMRGKKSHRWLDVRLFNEEGSIGYASMHPLGNNVPIIIFVISTAALFCLRALRTRSTFGKIHFTSSFMMVVCFITIPSFVILFFRAGKSSLLPPTPGVTKQNWACCSQGTVLPRAEVPGLIMELARREGEPPDMVLIEYAREQGMQRWALNPVMVQHLGMVSLYLLTLRMLILFFRIPDDVGSQAEIYVLEHGL
jgi:hypothetical protein